MATPQFSDNFNRPDSPDVGNGWIEKTPGVFSIQNDEVVKASSQTIYRDNIVYRPSSEETQNVQATLDFTDSNQYAPGWPQLWVRVQNNTVAESNTLDGYALVVPDVPSTAIVAQQHGSADYTTLATINLSQPITPGIEYRLVLSAIGSSPSVMLSADVEQYNGSSWQSIGSATVNDQSAAQIGTAGTEGFSGGTEGPRYAYTYFAYATLAGQAMASVLASAPASALSTLSTSELTSFLSPLSTSQIESMLASMTPAQQAVVLPALPSTTAAAIPASQVSSMLAAMSPSEQSTVLSHLPSSQLSALSTSQLSSMLSGMTSTQQSAVLGHLPSSTVASLPSSASSGLGGSATGSASGATGTLTSATGSVGSTTGSLTGSASGATGTLTSATGSVGTTAGSVGSLLP